MTETKVAKMKKKDYPKWLKKNAGKVRVVATMESGGLTNWYGPNKDLYVTYEVDQ